MRARTFLTALAVMAALSAAIISAGIVTPASAGRGAKAERSYVQTNLVSDIPGLAAQTDPNLKNPWARQSARAARSGCPITTPG